MYEFEPGPGETLVAELESFELQPNTLYAGVCTVSNKRVHMAPHRISRSQGAEGWEVLLDDIIKITPLANNLILLIRSKTQTYRIAGISTPQITEIIANHLEKDPERRKKRKGYAEGEEPIAAAQISLYPDPLTEITGQFVVTNKRVLFVPGSETSQTLRKLSTLNAPYTDLRDLQMKPGGKHMVLRTKEQAWEFKGNSAAMIYGLVWVGTRDNSAPLLGHYESIHVAGGTAHRGILVVSQSRMLFCPLPKEGPDTAWKHIHIRLAAMDCVAAIDGKLPHLRITSVGQHYVFAVHEPEQRALDLLGALIQVSGRDDPPACDEHQSIPNDQVPKLLVPWAKTFDFTPTASIFCGPAAWVFNGPALVRGWLYLTRQRVMFLPAADGGEVVPPLVLPVKNVLVSTETGEDSPQLALTYDAKTFRFFPRGGSPFVTQFQGFCQRERRKILEEAREKRLEQRGPERLGNSGNRRDSYRVQFPVPKPITVNTKSSSESKEPQTWRCFSNDISEGGLSVTGAKQPLPMATPVEVSFNVDYIPGTLKGKVVGQAKLEDESWRISVKFDGIDSSVRKIIRQQVMEAQREELELRASMQKD